MKERQVKVKQSVYETLCKKEKEIFDCDFSYSTDRTIVESSDSVEGITPKTMIKDKSIFLVQVVYFCSPMAEQAICRWNGSKLAGFQ